MTPPNGTPPQDPRLHLNLVPTHVSVEYELRSSLGRGLCAMHRFELWPGTPAVGMQIDVFDLPENMDGPLVVSEIYVSFGTPTEAPALNIVLEDVRILGCDEHSDQAFFEDCIEELIEAGWIVGDAHWWPQDQESRIDYKHEDFGEGDEEEDEKDS